MANDIANAAQNKVLVSPTSATLKYKTYDGSTMSIYKATNALTTVYLPWNLGADAYMVMLTGKWGTRDNTPIFATVKSQSASSFVVQCQDDPTANEGSFNFVVISTADFMQK